jgi:hypothetical protein
MLFYPLIILGAFAAMAIAMLGTFWLVNLGFPVAPIGLFTLVLAVVLLGGYGYLLRGTLIRRGYARFIGKKGLHGARNELEAIKNGRRHTWGVRVYSCDDSIWQRVVQDYAEKADAIIIDVSDSSENVLWELKTAEGIVGPESIILACARDGELRKLPDRVRSILASAIGPERLAGYPIFFYPTDVPQFGPRAAKIAGAIASELTNRLALAFDARDHRGARAVTG